MNCSQALRQFTLRMTDSCIFSSTGACSDNRARVTGAFWVGALLLICRLKGQRTDSVQKLKRALGYSAALMTWLSVKVYKRGSASVGVKTFSYPLCSTPKALDVAVPRRLQINDFAHERAGSDRLRHLFKRRAY